MTEMPLTFPADGREFEFVIVAESADAANLQARLTAGTGNPTVAGGGPAPLVVVVDGDADVEAVAQARHSVPGRPADVVVVLRTDLAEQLFPDDPATAPVFLRKPMSKLTARILQDYLRAKANGAQPTPVRPIQTFA